MFNVGLWQDGHNNKSSTSFFIGSLFYYFKFYSMGNSNKENGKIVVK